MKTTLPTTAEKPRSAQPGGGFCMALELFWGRARRAWLRAFRPGYVRAMREKRQGECPGCVHDIIDPRDLKYTRTQCGYWFPPEDDRFRWRARLGFARYGLAELMFFSLLLVSAAGLCLSGALLLHAAFWLPFAAAVLVWLEVVWFFRDPERPLPTDADALVSPADGTVTNVEEVDEPDFPGGRALRISIFLSIFNVHVNRAPRTARVAQVRYFPGAYLDARDPASAVRNEQLWLDLIEERTGRALRVKQISGAIARRIVCWVKPGDLCARGARFGMIKFGSRTDLLVAVDQVREVCVQVGAKVLGSSTLLLRLHSDERHEAEEARQLSEERYRLLFERNFAGVFRTRLDGQFLDCNQSFVHMLGYASRADILQRNSRELYVDPHDRTVILAWLHDRGQGLLTNFEVRLRRADGAAIWVLGNVSLLHEASGAASLEGTLINITARKEAEEALRASEARYRALVDNLDQAVFLKDRELRFLAANANFCRQLGCSESFLHGKTDFDLFPRERAEQQHQADLVVLNEGRATSVQEQVTVADQQRTIRTSRTPVRDAAGAVVAVLSVGWDVTDQLALEAQLRHVQKMDAVGQLAGGMAHDFNNLLTVILGNLSLLLEQAPLAEAAGEPLRSAEQATLRAAELTRTLLGFARRTPLQTIPLPLAAAVDEMLRLVRPVLAANIALEVEMPADLWPVEADPGQVNQVLMNLSLNARDAMPDGGRLLFQAANFVPDAEYLRAHVEALPGEYVRLRVADTGVGMLPEIRQRLFEPFFTTKPKGQGTGLGLAMVFGIVKQHRGWIECRSEPGHGTTFDLFLPRSRQEERAAPAPPGQANARRGEETILVVDDDNLIRQLAKNTLTAAGYRVLVAPDGETALQIYRVLRTGIALIVLDGMMPRRSGRETLEALAQLDPQVRVCFSTGFCAEQEAVRAFPQIRGYLPKPYRAEALTQKVREILDLPEPNSV
jgi:phosphatidylserine decarboxylase precursor-related protein